MELYSQASDKVYLEKAKEVWRFIESGIDDVLGGGIYWCEQKKRYRNTCFNAQGAIWRKRDSNLADNFVRNSTLLPRRNGSANLEVTTLQEVQ